MAGTGVRLEDVAARADVSVKTVSNVVRGVVNVAPATRARVQAAIDDLGYRPNLSARFLRSGRTGVVALALPELDAGYFSALARWTIAAAAERGLTVLIDQTDGLLDREIEVLDGIGAHLVDGVVMSPMSLAAEQLASRRGTAPLVLLGERLWDGTTDHVAVDNVAAAREATAHLLGIGRHRVAAVGAQAVQRTGTAPLRMRGYAEALAAAGREVDPSLVVEVGAFHRADGAAAARRLLELPDPPDAVFCFNDLLALGLVRELTRRGVRVPQDVAVVGFDGIEEGEYATPSLSTVLPDMAVLAARSVELLLELVAGVERAPVEVVVPHTLVVRESSGGPADPL